jgi:hypothetical protein
MPLHDVHWEYKMLQQIAVLLLLSCLLPQTAAVTKDEPTAPYDDADAYEVYSAIVTSEWPGRVTKTKTLVILSATKSYKMCLVPEKESEELIGQAISDYVKLNEKTWLLQQQKFKLETLPKLISPLELKTIFERSKWPGFYRQYEDSDGLIELSAVGFNTDKTVAVVYMGHSCGLTCGGGRFHVMQKKEGKWTPLEWLGESCEWAS